MLIVPFGIEIGGGLVGGYLVPVLIVPFGIEIMWGLLHIWLIHSVNCTVWN